MLRLATALRQRTAPSTVERRCTMRNRRDVCCWVTRTNPILVGGYCYMRPIATLDRSRRTFAADAGAPRPLLLARVDGSGRP